MTAAGLTRRFVVLRALRWLPLGFLLPFVVLIPDARGLSLPTIGALWAVHSVVTLVLEVPSGALADAVGRRRALLAGAVAMTVALAVFAFAETALAFAASLASLAAGRALVSGAAEAWYVDALRALEPDASLAPGLSRGTVAEASAMAVGALSSGAVPLLFSGLATTGGGPLVYTPSVLAATGASMLYLVAIATLVFEPPRGATRFRTGLGDVARAARGDIRGSAVVRTLLAAAAVFAAAQSSVELLWQPRLAELLGDAEDHSLLFGALVAGSMAMTAVGAASSPRVIRRLGARRGYAAFMVVSGLSIVGLALAGTPVALALAYLVFFAVLGVGDPVHFELLHEATGASARATVLSTESLATQGGAGVGNLGLAAIAGASGIPTAWGLAGAALAVAALLALRLPRAVPRPHPVTP
jgi:hypothetical protein